MKPPTELNDVTAPQHVQIEIRADEKVVWVNVDGVCMFRACRIGELEVVDHRPHKPPTGIQHVSDRDVDD